MVLLTGTSSPSSILSVVRSAATIIAGAFSSPPCRSLKITPSATTFPPKIFSIFPDLIFAPLSICTVLTPALSCTREYIPPLAALLKSAVLIASVESVMFAASIVALPPIWMPFGLTTKSGFAPVWVIVPRSSDTLSLVTRLRRAPAAVLKFSVSPAPTLKSFQLMMLFACVVIVAPFPTFARFPSLTATLPCSIAPPDGMANAEPVSASVMSAASELRRRFFFHFVCMQTIPFSPLSWGSTDPFSDALRNSCSPRNSTDGGSGAVRPDQPCLPA